MAGCAAQAPVPPGRLVPSETGLDVEGSSLEIGFGRAMPGAVAAASRLIGREPASRSQRGPACHVVTWPNGLEMHALDNAFVGWNDPTATNGRGSAGRLCPA